MATTTIAFQRQWAVVVCIIAVLLTLTFNSLLQNGVKNSDGCHGISEDLLEVNLLPTKATSGTTTSSSSSSLYSHFADRNVTLYPCNAFSDSYRKSRNAFRNAFENIVTTGGDDDNNNNKRPQYAGRLYTLPVIPEQDLTMEIAILEGTTPGLTIHISGTHGVEGYAGSAIQWTFLDLLRQIQQKEKQDNDDGADEESSSSLMSLPTVVLVHAFNPYGMEYNRRVNENNVDLNRNGLTFEEWNTDAIKKNHNREAYDALDELINPQRNLSSPTWWKWTIYIEMPIMALYSVVKHGMSYLKAALVRGQYHKPRGIFYGGTNHVERSVEVLYNFLQEHVIEQYAAASNKAVTTWVDVHTGLGESGRDSLLHIGGRNTSTESLPENEWDRWFPDSDVPSSSSAKEVSKGYEGVRGVLTDYYEEQLFTKAVRPLFFAQEFGTYSTIIVAHALIIENAAYHNQWPAGTDDDDDLSSNGSEVHDDNSSTSTAAASSSRRWWAERTTRYAFCPPDVTWKTNVVQRGIRVLFQALERSKQLSLA